MAKNFNFDLQRFAGGGWYVEVTGASSVKAWTDTTLVHSGLEGSDTSATAVANLFSGTGILGSVSGSEVTIKGLSFTGASATAQVGSDAFVIAAAVSGVQVKTNGGKTITYETSTQGSSGSGTGIGLSFAGSGADSATMVYASSTGGSAVAVTSATALSDAGVSSLAFSIESGVTLGITGSDYTVTSLADSGTGISWASADSATSILKFSLTNKGEGVKIGKQSSESEVTVTSDTSWVLSTASDGTISKLESITGGATISKLGIGETGSATVVTDNSFTGDLTFSDTKLSFTGTDSDGVNFTVVTSDIKVAEISSFDTTLNGAIGGMKINNFEFNTDTFTTGSDYTITGSSADSGTATSGVTVAGGTLNFTGNGSSTTVYLKDYGEFKLENASTDDSGVMLTASSDGSITISKITQGDKFTLGDVIYTYDSGTGLTGSDGKIYNNAALLASAQNVSSDATTSDTFIIGGTNATTVQAGLALVSDTVLTLSTEKISGITTTDQNVTDSSGNVYGKIKKSGASGSEVYTFTNSGASALKSLVASDVTVAVASGKGLVFQVGSDSGYYTATSVTGTYTLDGGANSLAGVNGTVQGALGHLSAVNGEALGSEVSSSDTVIYAIGNGTSLTGLSAIASNVTVTRSFVNGFSINGETVKVTGDEEIVVTGNNDTGTKVGGLSGINAGAVLVSVGSAANASLNGFGSEGQITIGSAAYTVKSGDSSNGAAVLGLSGTKLVGIGNFGGQSGYVAGDLTGLTSIGSTDTKVTISGDSSMKVTSDTALTFSNVGGNVTMTGAAMSGASVTTDSVGSFKLGNTAALTVAGDSSVTFGLSSETVVTSIANFDAGTISGSLNGITFATGTTIGDAALEISGDSSIAMVAADGALSISNLSNNAVLTSAGGATKATTDQAGKFTFGNQVVSVAGDSSVEFALTDNKVSGVASITSATLNVDSSTTELKINGAETAVSLSAADASKGTTLMFDASGNLSTVSGASSVDGLGESNLTVIGGTSGLSVAGTSIAITGDSAFNVAVVEGKVGEITGISDKATVAYGNGTLKTDTEGTFVLGGTSYVVSGDDAITFLTGEAGSLSAVQDLVGTIKTATTSMSINGDEVSISLASGEPTLTYAADASGITAISGLTNGATVTGAVDAAIAMAVDSSVGTLTANDVVYEILSGDKDGVTITGGSAISGLDNGAYMTVGAAGQYTVNGTALNLSYGDTIQGTDGGNTAKIYSESDIQEIPESISSNVEEIAKTIIDTTEYATLSSSEQESVVDAVTGASSDKSAADGDMKLSVGNSDSSEAQNVDFSSNTGKKDVTLTTGEQAIKFNNEGGNVAEIGKDATGTKAVELGDGGDVVAIAKGTKAEVNVVAGKGADTIVSGADATVDVGNGGATKVRATSGATVTMNNYDATTSKAGVQTTSSDIAAAIQNGFINLTDGAVSTGEGSNKSTVVVNGTSSSDLVESADTSTEGSTVVNLYNDKGKMTKVGFTHSEGGSVDLSGQKAAVVMQGNNVTGSSSKTGESTIISGSGNDTIFAGAGDVVDAGAGANTLVLASERNSAETGAVIQMNSATGRNKVQNFKTGFADGDDAVVVDLSSASFTVDNSGNVIVKNGRARTTIEGSASADATDSYTSMLVQDSASGVTYKAALASEGNTIAVSADEESFADAYVGNGSGLDFTSYEGTATVDLTSGAVLGGSTFDGQSVVVQGINSVALGESDGAAYGSADKETLKAGSGTASIWSGAGKDLMVGYSGSDDDKNGVATFAFLTGDGKDTISGFHALTADNANTADKIFTTANFDFSDVKVSSEGNVVLHFADNSSDVLTLTNAADKNIQVAVGALDATPVVFKAGISAVTYDGLATQYIATANSATVSASSEVSSANIWLENQFNLDSNSYIGNFKAIDASKVEGQATLVGNSFENVITAAQENTSMWGGSSTSNDTLIGGNGNDMFFYGVTGGNEGNDTITGVTEDDTINLFGITLDQIDLANTVANKSTITVKFNAGGSLTMASSGQTFILANDTNQSYKYDKDESTWVQA